MKPVISRPENSKGKSLVIHHRDLDGTFGFIVVEKFLKELFHSGYYVERVATGYERVNPKCESYWETHENYDFIILVDICCDEERMKSAPSNVYVFDHHDTSKDTCEQNPNFYWDESVCGATVAMKYLLNVKDQTPEFMKMVKICDNYDMWRGSVSPLGSKPPQISFKMNALYQSTPELNDFIARWRNGFDGFTDKENTQIKEYFSRQKTHYKKITKVEDPPLFIGVLTEWDMDLNLVCCNLMEKRGYKGVMIIRTPTERISLRLAPCLSGKIHAGRWLIDNVQNKYDSKGGHELAAGCSYEGNDLGDVIAWAEKLKEDIETVENG